MKAIVSRYELEAALLFISTDETRFVLNGILVELKPDCMPLLVSTDGRRIAALETSAVQVFEEKDLVFEKPHSFILRKEIVKTMIHISKCWGGKLFPWICLENNQGSKRIIAHFLGSDLVLEAEKDALIEGNYPDWKQVIPDASITREPITEVGLNGGFLLDYLKVPKILKSAESAICFNLVGNDAGVEINVGGLRQFYGYLMPLKINKIDYQPDFLKVLEPKQEAA